MLSVPTDTLQADVTVPVWETSTTAGDISVELAQLFVETHQAIC